MANIIAIYFMLELSVIKIINSTCRLYLKNIYKKKIIFNKFIALSNVILNSLKIMNNINRRVLTI